MYFSLEEKLKEWSANGHFLWATKKAFQLTEAPAELEQVIHELSCGKNDSLPTVELLDGRIMGGLRGAYTHSDPKGNEKIYLNLDWIEVADNDQIDAVLLEEIGHALDFKINGIIDTAGDEGAIFSALIRNEILASNQSTQSDHHTISIDGINTAIEASLPEPMMVKDINAGAGSSSPRLLSNFNNKLYFIANDGTNGQELWHSDGTASGTTIVKDIRAGGSSSSPSNLTVFDNKLFFSANDGTNGSELWQSDGTASGTTIVKNIRAGGSSSSPSNLTVFDNKLFFSANDGTNGSELWQSDGTASGTTIVKDIRTGVGHSYPHNLKVLENDLSFMVYNNSGGYSLWKSNGTPDGTTEIADLSNGGEGPQGSFIFDGKYLFTQSLNATGYELWESDGTTEGTKLRAEINNGNGSSYPENFATFNEKLFFGANNGTNGAELWSMEATPAPAPAPTPPSPTPSDDDGDSTPPELRSALVASDGQSLILNFNEPLASTTRHVSPAFVVDVDAQSIPVIDATTRGNELTLSLRRPIRNDQSVAITYTDRSSDNDRNDLSIGDAAGNDLASLARFPVQNRSTLAGTPPSISRAVSSADGRSLALSYDEPLAPFAPPASAFSLSVDGVRSAFSSLTLAGSNARLILPAPLFQGQSLLLDYRDPTAADDRLAIQDIHGNDALNVQGLIVENNSTVIDPATLVPLTPPLPLPTAAPQPPPTAAPPQTPVSALSQPTKQRPPTTTTPPSSPSTAPTPPPTTPATTQTTPPTPTAQPIPGCDPDAEPAISTSQLDRFTLLIGTPCPDRIVGTPADDILRGEGGNDTLRGLAGGDRLRGGIGADYLDGGRGQDTISGGIGADRIRGGSADDQLHGQAGADFIKGYSGDDQLFGGRDRDSLDGGLGNDTLEGGRGADLFRLSAGTDQIVDFNIADGDRIQRPRSTADQTPIKLSISQPQPDQLLILDTQNGINTTILNTDITPKQLLEGLPKLFSQTIQNE